MLKSALLYLFCLLKLLSAIEPKELSIGIQKMYGDTCLLTLSSTITRTFYHNKHDVIVYIHVLVNLSAVNAFSLFSCRVIVILIFNFKLFFGSITDKRKS